MRALLLAERLRVGRRADVWILLLLVTAITVIGYFSGLSSATSMGSYPGDDLPPDVLKQIEEASREALGAYAFPRSIQTGLAGGRPLILMLTAYLAAAITGADFEYRTIRTSLVARGDRRGFVLVRLASVVFVAGCLLAAATLLSIILPQIAVAAGTDFPQVTGPDAAGALGMLGATLLTIVLIAGLTTAFTIAFRNPVVGIALTLATALADAGVVGLITRLGGEDAPLRWVTPLGNAQLLFDRANDIITGPDWPTGLAVALGLGWAALTCVGAVALLLRADVNA